MGDPAGVGPEVAIKAVVNGDLDALCNPLLIGNAHALRSAIRFCALKTELAVVRNITDARFGSGRVVVLDPEDLGADDFAVVPWFAGSNSPMNLRRLVRLTV
jgi:4-hydroxy-L-threonine phosphate dehydrogenase PdxA